MVDNKTQALPIVDKSTTFMCCQCLLKVKGAVLTQHDTLYPIIKGKKIWGFHLRYSGAWGTDPSYCKTCFVKYLKALQKLREERNKDASKK